MSDLSNLYISQSYKGLINLADSTEGITSQSNYELQDGLGVGIGVSITGSSLLVENDISSSTLNGMGNVEIFSASVDLRLDDLELFSSSINLQTASFSQWTASVFDPFSTSVDERIIINANNIDTKLDTASFNNWTSSVYEPFSSSVDFRLDDLASFTGSYATTGSNLFRGNQVISGSVFTRDVSPAPSTTFKIDTGNPSPFLEINNAALSGIVGTDAVINGDILYNGDIVHNGDTTQSGSFSQLGDTHKIGNTEQTGSFNISGSMTYHGRVRGNVVQMQLTGSDFNTASFEPLDGNFHVLDLNEVTGSVCRIEVPQGSNITSGLTITLKVKQPITSYCTLQFASESFEFPRLTQPITTPINGATDIFTFVSFDNQAYYGIITKDLTTQIT